MSTRLRVLLVEPYLGGSHRAWAEGYAAHSAHQVELVSHQARFWKWRMQGSALTLAEWAREVIDRDGPPDVVLASDMLDLAAFLGVLRRELVGTATVLYMHENQLTYPPPPELDPDHTYAAINWRSVAAADAVWFNSEFHRREFFDALPGFLKSFPDYDHLHLVEAAAARSEVMPVGVDLRRLDAQVRRHPPPMVLWNQRWEYDKNPQEFFAALDAVAVAGVDFRVAVAGENFRQRPAEFEAARRRLGERVVHFGFADSADYARLLAEADVVVSTAHHEFFGVAMVEAVAAGAFPLLPDRLSYPELIPALHHGLCLYRGFDDLVERLARALRDPAGLRTVAADLSKAMRRFDWSSVAHHYDRRLMALVGRVAAAPTGATLAGPQPQENG